MWRVVPLLLASCSFRGPSLIDDSQPGDDGGGGTEDGVPDAPGLQRSCKAILEVTPGAASGVYTIDPDGDGPTAAFEVACDMTTMIGGWTLVARELVGAAPSAAGPLRFLGVDSMNASMLAAGAEGGIIAIRLAGAYNEVLITWGTDYIRFAAPPGFEMFGNVLASAVPITGFATSDPRLIGWVTQDGGTVLCIASRSTDIRPGNSSWAIKPKADANTGCGCNSTGWAGRGAYYGGAGADTTLCGPWGGAWSGVKDNGEAKAGLAPTVETRIWIR